MLNKKGNKWLFFLLVLALISLVMGLYNLNKYGVDCQIEGCKYLVKQESPYSVFLKGHQDFLQNITSGVPESLNRKMSAQIFRYNRFPTHLPQSYFVLMPFFLFGQMGYLLYGLVGVGLLFIPLLWLENKRSYLQIALLIILTVSYRNNLGNGQFLFFHLGLFLIWDRLMVSRRNDLLIYAGAGSLLLMLMSKPTIFFWVVFCYPLSRKTITVYLIALVLQIAVIGLFGFLTSTGFNEVVKDYFDVMQLHGAQNNTVISVFNVGFSSMLRGGNSFFVILSLVGILFLIYHSLFRGLELDRSVWMFCSISLSFIFIYHRHYETFIFLMPLGVSDRGWFSFRRFSVVLLVVVLVGYKFIFVLNESSPLLSYELVNVFITASVCMVIIEAVFFQVYDRKLIFFSKPGIRNLNE